MKYLKSKLGLIFVLFEFLFLYIFSFNFVSAKTMAQNLAGRILLQVESMGEAWYVEPVSLKRIYLADRNSAYNLMRSRGLGIKNADLIKIPIGMADMENDAPMTGWNLYINKVNGFSFYYPETWKIIKPTVEQVALGAIVFLQDPGAQKLDSSVDSGYVYSVRISKQDQQDNNSVILQDLGETMVGNKKGQQLIFNGASSSSRYGVSIENDGVYEILFDFAWDETQLSQEEKKLLSTFKFFDKDVDSDGLSDRLEEAIGTDPTKSDTDGDGFSDYNEINGGYSLVGSGKLKIDKNFANKFKGKILLQVESRGEAWYVNPADGKRYYMPTGDAAYQIMKFLSLGIKSKDLYSIPLDLNSWQLYSLNNMGFNIHLPKGFIVGNSASSGSEDGKVFSESISVWGSEIIKNQQGETIIDHEGIQFNKYKKEGSESIEQAFARTWNLQKYYDIKNAKVGNVNALEYVLKEEYSSGQLTPRIFVFGNDKFIYTALIRNFDSSMYIDILNTIGFNNFFNNKKISPKITKLGEMPEKNKELPGSDLQYTFYYFDPTFEKVAYIIPAEKFKSRIYVANELGEEYDSISVPIEPFSLYGKHFIYTASNDMPKREGYLVLDGKKIHTLDGYQERFWSDPIFSRDGSKLLIKVISLNDDQGKLLVFDTSAGAIEKNIEGYNIQKPFFSPDNKVVYFASDSNSNIETKYSLYYDDKTIPLHNDSNNIPELFLSRDGTKLAYIGSVKKEDDDRFDYFVVEINVNSFQEKIGKTYDTISQFGNIGFTYDNKVVYQVFDNLNFLVIGSEEQKKYSGIWWFKVSPNGKSIYYAPTDAPLVLNGQEREGMISIGYDPNGDSYAYVERSVERKSIDSSEFFIYKGNKYGMYSGISVMTISPNQKYAAFSVPSYKEPKDMYDPKAKRDYMKFVIVDQAGNFFETEPYESIKISLSDNKAVFGARTGNEFFRLEYVLP